jgi:hypothetical protein
MDTRLWVHGLSAGSGAHDRSTEAEAAAWSRAQKAERSGPARIPGAAVPDGPQAQASGAGDKGERTAGGGGRKLAENPPKGFSEQILIISFRLSLSYATNSCHSWRTCM